MPYKVMTSNDVAGIGVQNGAPPRKTLEAQEVGLNVLERDGWRLVGMGSTAITKELVLYLHKSE